MRRAWVIVVPMLVLGGCSGELSMRKLNPAEDFRKDPKVNGVIVYLPRLVRATYVLTQYKDDAGKMSGACTQVKFDKLDLVPDTAVPYALVYRPELLSTHKFSVSISNGLVTAINTESESAFAKTLEALASAAQKAATVAAPDARIPLGAPPDCNTTQQLIEVKQVTITQ